MFDLVPRARVPLTCHLKQNTVFSVTLEKIVIFLRPVEMSDIFILQNMDIYLEFRS